MWKRSFVATTVALGDGVDDALAALGIGAAASDIQRGTPDLGASASELVAQLRAPHRATRATALAKAVHEIVLRIDEGTLR